MKAKIENIDDLRLEIGRLEFQCVQQEAVLSYRIKTVADKLRTPLKILDKLSTWFGSNSDKAKDGQDWVSSALQAILPMALDKIFFRKSGFIIKALAALASQNAATLINKNTLVGWINTLSQWVRSTHDKKEDKHHTVDFGIPPDSETY